MTVQGKQTNLDGILLAAGESRRMGFPKPLLTIDGRTFLETISATMLAVVPRVIVVLGAHAARIRPAVPRDARITVLENRGYALGQLSSLKLALDAIGPASDGAMVHLADHPRVREDSFRAIADAYYRTRSPIVIARYAGRRGHPLIFDRSIFAELRGAPLEEGARYVVNADPGRVLYLDVDDPGVNLDLDTPGDLVRAGLPPPPPDNVKVKAKD